MFLEIQIKLHEKFRSLIYPEMLSSITNLKMLLCTSVACIDALWPQTQTHAHKTFNDYCFHCIQPLEITEVEQI